MLAIELSSRNVKEGTSGPFGAAVFKRNIKSKDQIDLVSIGVNRVVPLHNSTLHGEMVAIQLAQNHVQSFALRCPHDELQYELFTAQSRLRLSRRHYDVYARLQRQQGPQLLLHM